MKNNLLQFRKPDNTKRLISLFFLSLLLFSAYKFVFRSYGYASIVPGFAIFGTLVSIVALQSIWIDLLPGKTKKRFAEVIFLFIVGIPFVGILYLSKYQYENYQINTNGIETMAVVTAFETEYTKQGEQFYATIQYQVKGETITQRLNNNDNYYHKNDTVIIRCSSRHPEMFKIIKDWMAWFCHVYMQQQKTIWQVSKSILISWKNTW